MPQKEGYLFVDHRASPGISEEAALKMGLDPNLVREGKVFEAATLACAHCPSVVIKNPMRVRERAMCMSCGGAYLCDACAIASKMPDYVHIPRKKMIDMVCDGPYEMSGSTSLPIFTLKRKGEL